ncbi:universal stress protein [Halococcoides cellulosivorans]|uniref:Universal stress protein n=1 Tax=Halococcoides cellulosivorans TaxID=1679096 RepID=A0A2R4X4I2_9EURY|nr:universal stress protein [Halococcoides cellulosivorans]AWB28702.1 universal stress protein [Halococcoides cellulosivorans]
MIDTVVLTTDGSASADRAVRVALDLADRFDATIHALYVVDTVEVEASPKQVREDLHEALLDSGHDALDALQERTDSQIETVVREGEPTDEICAYADEIDADVIATGTRGRHGEHALLLGSVAESVVRRATMPVLTVRQLDEEEAAA